MNDQSARADFTLRAAANALDAAANLRMRNRQREDGTCIHHKDQQAETCPCVAHDRAYHPGLGVF